jgi:hypothetical protein
MLYRTFATLRVVHVQAASCVHHIKNKMETVIHEEQSKAALIL